MKTSDVSNFGQQRPTVNCKADDTKLCTPATSWWEKGREEEEKCELAALKLLDIYSRIEQLSDIWQIMRTKFLSVEKEVTRRITRKQKGTKCQNDPCGAALKFEILVGARNRDKYVWIHDLV